MLKMTIQETPHFVLEQCEQLFFRQSFLYDYSTCPKMAYYRWVEESQTADFAFMAGILGTAGHDVIFQIHEERRYDLDSSQLMDRFDAAFTKALAESREQPRIGAQYASVAEHMAAEMPEYLRLLDGYQQHPHNHEFNSTIHEQAFVLKVSPVKEGAEPYIFTGTMDQAGYYDDGTFALRDIKFRANDFRPSMRQFSLDMQMTIYAAALAAGDPACSACRPTYQIEPVSLTKKLVYNGPCENCAKLIGTAKWPKKFPEKCELVWMRDFKKYTEDKVKDKFVIDNSGGVASKVPNPSGKGPKVFPRKLNPAWEKGPKAGDYYGPCFIHTYREPERLKVLMSDILCMCDAIRRGEFYRRPGDHCSFWCKYVETCTANIRVQADAATMQKSALFTTVDPFA